jgi:quinol-cytochrome oxidoreductase complex cytochrome b subunit
MKNPNSKRKYCAVLIAAIMGAAFFGALLPLDNLAYSLWKWNDQGFAYILVIPSAEICNAFFGKDFNSSALIINPIIGAISFALITVFWQFVLKSNHESKN